MRTAILLAVVLAAAPAAAHLEPGKLVDLTYPYDAETIYWPTENGFVLEKEFEGVTEGGYFYAANRFCAPEHGGTHVDAPLHFFQAGRSVDVLPLEQLVGAGVLVDVARRTERNRDYQVRIIDFTDWEAKHGRIPERAIVLLRTGHGRFWPDRARYMGTAERGKDAVAKLHFPGLHPDAARWLVRERRIAAVGLDTPSIDHGQSTRFQTHVALFERGVPAFENVANLERLPATGFTVIALPMKIRGGSGGPLRIVALVPE